MIELTELTKTYRVHDNRVNALDGVSLHIEPGEFIAIQGASGCGKTTLLLSIGALLMPSSGTVMIDGYNPYMLSSEARAQFRAAHIGFVFQQFHLVPYLDVADNIAAPAIAMPAANVHARTAELLEQVGLTARAHHVPSELSIGERQRAGLARALFNRPKILLADEPTGNLDPANAGVVLAHLAEFAAAGGAVLLVTHDPHAAAQAQRIIRMSEGRLIETA